MDQQCEAITKKGTQCPNWSTAGTLCHVHDPERQCGVKKRNGTACTIPTGGVRCKYHPEVAPVKKKRERRPRYSPEERAARRAERVKADRLREQNIDAVLAELDMIGAA